MKNQPGAQKNPFELARQLYAAGEYEKAADQFLKYTKDEQLAPFAYYMLAGISNITEDPLTAKTLYYKALTLAPDICNYMFADGHPNKNYRFSKLKEEPAVEICPLCEKSGKPHWCYNMLEMSAAYVQAFNPIRLWMYCEDCHHMYAEEFPVQEVKKADPSKPAAPMPTKSHLFSFYSEVLTKLGQFTHGNEVLEIGVGGCECTLAAQEMGFNVLGIDIAEANVIQARKYGLNAEVCDFMNFESDRKWDIIILGDVIEHVSDPVRAMEKVVELLNDGGVIWISTPNFDGAFAIMAGHDDPMRKTANHKYYFSRHSLFSLLNRFQLMPVDYRISSHYNGSIEVIAVRNPDEAS